MGRVADWMRGRDLIPEDARSFDESRTLAPTASRETFDCSPMRNTSLPAVSESSALKIADVFAATRCLADGLASLPLKPYRRVPEGRIPAGNDARISQLLRLPSPGSTSSDLVSQIVIDLCVSGTAFLAKYRSDDAIVQLGTLPPEQVSVEQCGQRIIYRLSRREGVSEHGPEDIIAIKSATRDGLVGMSPVRQCARALQINEGLLSYAGAWLSNAGRPSGILSLAGGDLPRSDDGADLKRDWQDLFSLRDAGQNAGKIAVLSGDNLNFERVEPAMKDQEFLSQREWSVRETARIFGIPPFKLGVSSGDSLTYSTVSQENRAFVDMSLRPLAVRIERALDSDPDLCPGSTYVQFSFDGLLRGDTRERYDAYKTAIEAGFLSIEEVRELEDLPRRAG